MDLKKIGIVTFVRAYNYGAILQSYALNYAINSLGFCCLTVDYFPKYFFDEYCRYKKISKKNLFNFRTWFDIFKWNYLIRRRCLNFNKFIIHNIKLTQNISSFNDLNKLSFDYIVFGSDQIWDLIINRNDDFYFGGWTDSPKIAYAISFSSSASVAKTFSLHNDEILKFSNLSFREKEYINNVPLHFHKSLDVVCDPVFLLDYEKWDLCAGKKNNKKYVLIYFVKYSPALISSAYKFGVENNLPVVCIPCNMSKNVFDGKNLKKDFPNIIIKNMLGPSSFLGFLRDASYVFTNSFHGTAFSFIFHKELFLEVNENERIQHLLSTFCIYDSKFKNNISAVTKNVDWEQVDEIINECKTNSVNYLLESFKCL